MVGDCCKKQIIRVGIGTLLSPILITHWGTLDGPLTSLALRIFLMQATPGDSTTQRFACLRFGFQS